MAKYRKRPVVVEAEQFDPVMNPRPVGFHSWDEESYQPRDMSWGYVVTIHGQKAHVQAGDWIITEPNGVNHYPCKHEIFVETYDECPVEV